VYDVTKSYNLVLLALIPACICASTLLLMLGRYPDHDAAAAGG
jgi:hypothetical protein